MGPFFLEAFRYHRWANLHLIGVCGGLTDEQLELTTTGTYGTIAATLVHLLGAEQGYIRRLGGSERRLTTGARFPGIAALKKEAERSADELLDLASRIQPDEEFEADFEDGHYRVRKGIVLIQALHHGNDHRTHICTILGAHQIEYGDMDVWAYGDAIGDIVPIGAA